MRDYKNIDKYLDILQQDIYSQVTDEGHDEMLRGVMSWFTPHRLGNHSVLDIGCGSRAIAFPYFYNMGIAYTGVSLGENLDELREIIFSPNSIHNMDMSFLEFDDNSYDIIYARHVLEHSPMPLLTLMEWHRVATNNLFLVLPNPEKFGYIGRNHYSVMTRTQIRWLLRRAGWKVINKEYTTDEYWFVCEKLPLIGYEGWAENPLDPKIYEEDRDE